MGKKSGIAWTDATWNIATGCTKVDEDCKFCYMYRQSNDSSRYDPLTIVRTKKAFNLPLNIKEPSKIFACSLTDFFHPGIDSFRDEAWEIIRKCPQHTFQILTKRPERVMKNLPPDWGDGYPNVWLGTSVGSEGGLQRIIDLHSCKAKVKFLSIEPLWGPVDLEYPESIYGKDLKMCCNGHECGCMGKPIDPPLLYGLDWIIVGGESGNETGKYRYRPCEIEWIENIVDSCKRYNVPVFVKQMGTYLSKKLGMSDSHGSEIDEFPAHLKIREFPNVK